MRCLIAFYISLERITFRSSLGKGFRNSINGIEQTAIPGYPSWRCDFFSQKGRRTDKLIGKLHSKNSINTLNFSGKSQFF